MVYISVEEILISLPESQLHPSMIELVKKWVDPPNPHEVMEVLDKCFKGNLAERWVLETLSGVLDLVCNKAGVTLTQACIGANWRPKGSLPILELKRVPYVTRRPGKFPKGTPCFAQRLEPSFNIQLQFEDGSVEDLSENMFLFGYEDPVALTVITEEGGDPHTLYDA
jgi:hypothetical protein